ncbi:unnamed protein product [Mytilus coruscus]|uniref:Uncharacterized protein n=1 Tax=Mytilus coruscus TaxID=42192 RepID=A0A6J8AYT4_MYTCO|nr:unnamed protein product [Mytilus coruscus]
MYIDILRGINIVPSQKVNLLIKLDNLDLYTISGIKITPTNLKPKDIQHVLNQNTIPKAQLKWETEFDISIDWKSFWGRGIKAAKSYGLVNTRNKLVNIRIDITILKMPGKGPGHLPNIQTPPQEDLDISSTSTGRIMIKGNDEPLYSNSDVPVGDLSIYSLAMADSEPGDNKDTPDKQYDSVTYKEPRNTDEDKHYDHIMENHYQNPYS